MYSSYMFVVSVKRRRTLLSGTGSVELQVIKLVQFAGNTSTHRIYTATRVVKSFSCI